MIVKILPRSNRFSAIKYNFDKVLAGQADLICQRNMDILYGYFNLTPINYRYYFEAISKLNPTSKFDQFHAVVSTKGESVTGKDLGQIAEDWLKNMGYANQPYLIFFHRDTENNHVHIVSTDVRADGSKLSHKFNYVRAQKVMNKLMGIDPEKELRAELTSLLNYTFTDLKQFKVLLSRKGYKIYTKDGIFKIGRYGQLLISIDESRLANIILTKMDDQSKIRDIQRIVFTAAQTFNSDCYPVFSKAPNGHSGRIIGYESALSVYLMQKYNLELFYHIQKNGVTGFTVIDHQSRQVFNGDALRDVTQNHNIDIERVEYYNVRRRL